MADFRPYSVYKSQKLNETKNNLNGFRKAKWLNIFKVFSLCNFI